MCYGAYPCCLGHSLLERGMVAPIPWSGAESLAEQMPSSHVQSHPDSRLKVQEYLFFSFDWLNHYDSLSSAVQNMDQLLPSAGHRSSSKSHPILYKGIVHQKPSVSSVLCSDAK